VNIVPVRSLFRWKGEISDEEEELIIAKTRAVLVPALEAEIRRLHSYEIPEIIALPVAGGLPAYLSWVGQETAI
jgi:periplasmic divalent cation tolerance protein